MVVGEIMEDTNEESDDFTFYNEVRSSRKSTKEKILDESFKKAEKSKGIETNDGQDLLKKSHFLKLGVLFIIVAILALVIINYVPWMFIKFDAEYGTINAFFDKDFVNKENEYYLEMDYIFESKCNNCSDNSKNFIGITKDDFIDIPVMSTLASYILIILGIAFTIIEILEQFGKFSRDLIIIIHSLFATAGIIFGTYLIFINIKFISVYFLSYYNTMFIETSGLSNVIFLFLAPLFLIMISIGIIIISIIVININLRGYEKKRRYEEMV